MAKKNRPVAYGSIYQVLHRLKKDSIIDSNDKIKLLSCFGAAKEKYDFFLLGYCILDDSYYLIIKTHNISISKIMQSINTSYGKYYNSKYKKSPFKGRFKSDIIREDRLLDRINYIHNLPIGYNPFTSHSFYQMNVDSIVDIEYVLDLLSSDRVKAIEEYTSYITSKPKEPKDDDALNLNIILKEICPNEEDFNLIKAGSKKSYLMEYKRKFIQEALNSGYSSKVIGRTMDISDRAVRKHMGILKKEE